MASGFFLECHMYMYSTRRLLSHNRPRLILHGYNLYELIKLQISASSNRLWIALNRLWTLWIVKN